MGTVYNPLHRSYPLFFFGLLVAVAYIPGIIGGSISTGWLLLLIICPILLFYCDISLSWGFAFICYATISLVWTEILNIAWFHLLQLMVLGLVFVIGQNIKDLTAIFKGLALGLGVSAVVCLFQWYGFHSIYSLSNTPAGLFINPNIFSEVSAIILVGLVVLKLYWWIPVTLPGLIIVHSRAAYVGLGVGLFFAVWKYNRYYAMILVGLILVIGAFGNFNLASVKERFDLWADTIQGFKFFGNGVGSYEALFPYYATHIDTELARPRYAHNDLLQIIFEFGIGSILLLVAAFNVFKTRKPEVVIILTIGAISLFTYPLHIPVPAFIAFLVAGFVIGNHATDGVVWNTSGSGLFKSDTARKLCKA